MFCFQNEKKFATKYNHASIRSLNSLQTRHDTPTINSTPLSSLGNNNPLYSPALSPRSEVTITSDENAHGFTNAAFDQLPEDYYQSDEPADEDIEGSINELEN